MIALFDWIIRLLSDLWKDYFVSWLMYLLVVQVVPWMQGF